MTYTKKTNKKGLDVFKFEEGGICEEKYFYIIKDMPLVPDSPYSHQCRHTVEGVTPWVVKAVNEGGHNVTEVCVQCILEAMGEIDGKV